MPVPNLVFDIVLFGALLVAAFADGAYPALAGAASLVVVGLATYIAAQEWSTLLDKRRIWTQESLATAITLSVLGFIYFWWRNDKDLALLVLSVALMMASLMVAIATIAALGAVTKKVSLAPLGGWLLTVTGGLVLGALGGVLVLFLGGGATLFAKLLVIGLSVFGWKIRETIRPPQENFHLGSPPLKAPAPEATPRRSSSRERSHTPVPTSHAQTILVFPRRGTLLDRFMPVLIIGTVLFVAAHQIKSPDFWTPTPPAAADNGNADNGNADNGSTP